MKVAVITVTRNDIYRFEEWCQYYEEYKKDIYLHIIVDDASDIEYSNKIKEYFKDSLIIRRDKNGGSNAALNDAISHILTNNKEVDAIFVLDNDIKLKEGCIEALYNYLYSDEKLGMVGPLVLRKDSDIIEDFGVRLTMVDTVFINSGDKAELIPQNKTMYVDVVPGGINMCKRSYYENVGLQDETIFMYCDERDMAFRTKKAGLFNGVTSSAVAWHQHKYCPPVGKRLRSMFLLSRNRIYLQKKHKGFFAALILFLWNSLIISLVIIKYIKDPQKIKDYKERMRGNLCGILGNMDNSNIWF